MTDREILEKLEELLARLEIGLVREPGEFSGGACAESEGRIDLF